MGNFFLEKVKKKDITDMQRKRKSDHIKWSVKTTKERKRQKYEQETRTINRKQIGWILIQHYQQSLLNSNSLNVPIKRQIVTVDQERKHNIYNVYKKPIENLKTQIKSKWTEKDVSQ